MNDLTSVLKDRAIFLGWIAGLVLIASLLWIFTFNFRSACLMHSANKILVSMNDDRRLSAPLPRPSGPAPLGCWYRISGSDSLFFVFAILQGGILVPCGAEISGEGKVLNVIPLGSHALQMMDRLPRGMVQVYVNRIESSAASGVTGRGNNR
ncbi:MAG: hypothetical protein FWC24_03945 [Treponema sp.]|nr:hypothetical protein [Treponema sp.]